LHVKCRKFMVVIFLPRLFLCNVSLAYTSRWKENEYHKLQNCLQANTNCLERIYCKQLLIYHARNEIHMQVLTWHHKRNVAFQLKEVNTFYFLFWLTNPKDRFSFSDCLLGSIRVDILNYETGPKEFSCCNRNILC
jgi:hypothetical protein